MSNILDSEDFGLKLYNKFPPKYQADDVEQNFALKRYLESLADGGFKHAIDDVNGLMHMIDPNKVDEKFLPLLFKQYGLEVFNGIPSNYLRYLLPRLSGAWSKKGSLSAIEFISSSLSGIKTIANVHYDAYGNPFIDVKFDMEHNIGDYFPDTEQFNRILKHFLPFYCDIVLYYMYMDEDGSKLLCDEEEVTPMHIKNTVDEMSFIPSEARYLFKVQTNTEDKLLNSTLILNELEGAISDPDSVTDTIIVGDKRTVIYN